jgi:hypothetical protein
MAEESEVIQSDIEETRSSLADKLAQLGDKVSGTVETVEETVEDVIETAEDTVEAVKDTFDLPLQMERHPWLFVGGAALLGFLGGRLLFPGSAEEERDWDSERAFRAFVNGRSGNGHSEREAADMTERMSQAAESGPTTGTAESSPESSESGWFSGDWLSGLTDKMGPELETLKGLALGAAFGLVRDMVARNLPDSLTSEISHLFDDMTERAGGKPVQGEVLGSSDAEEDAEGAEGEQGQEAQEQEESAESESGHKNRGKKRGKNHRLAHR